MPYSKTEVLGSFRCQITLHVTRYHVIDWSSCNAVSLIRVGSWKRQTKGTLRANARRCAACPKSPLKPFSQVDCLISSTGQPTIRIRLVGFWIKLSTWKRNPRRIAQHVVCNPWWHLKGLYRGNQSWRTAQQAAFWMIFDPKADLSYSKIKVYGSYG